MSGQVKILLIIYYCTTFHKWEVYYELLGYKRKLCPQILNHIRNKIIMYVYDKEKTFAILKE